jgi:ribosomal protein RSM22 (predicted rRNA methylase)
LLEILKKKKSEKKKEVIFVDLSAGVCSASSAFIFILDFISQKDQTLADLKVKVFVQDISDIALDFGIKILNQVAKGVPFEVQIEKIVSDASRINIKKEIGENPDIVFLAFSLYDIFRDDTDSMISWSDKILKATSDLGVFALVEPALKRRNSLFIMKIREALKNYVIAPCTHYEACPVLKIKDDWCHFGTKWVPPLSLSRGMNLIGGRVPEINFSYLVLSKNKDFSRWKNLHRVVSHKLEEKGRIRFWTCSSSGKNLFQILERNIGEKNSDVESVHSGDVVFINEAKERNGFFELDQNSEFKIVDCLFRHDFFER